MKKLFKAFILVFPIVILMGCSSDDNITPIPSTQISTTFSLSSIYDNSVTGTAKFIKNDDNSTTVELKLEGIPTGEPHPASINYNTAAEGGNVAVTLGTVSDVTGYSTISFSTLDDGTPITYDELISFDGYVNVLYSADQPDNNIAQGDIGENELTGVSTTYSLGEKDVPGMSGSIVFSQRENGESLAVLQLINPNSGNLYPASIYNNTAVEGGSIALTFNPIDGNTGISATNVTELDNGVSFLYIDIVSFDGYINILASETNPGIIIAQGDIGENELTGVSTTYVLNEVDASGISGNVTFYARNSGEALAVILLQNTIMGEMNPAHIYSNDVATGGDIMFNFNPVDGDTGMSQTNVAALLDDSLFGYADVLGVDAHINVLLNDLQPPTVISQGNIGSNN